MVKKLVAIVMVCVMLLSLAACGNSNNTTPQDDTQQRLDAAKTEAQVVVDGFMQEFCAFNLKNMIEYTDADVDYTQMEYLSLDEVERELLSEFAIFEAMGLPLDGFKDLVNQLFDAYSKYATYTIVNAQANSETEVIFTVNAEYITLAKMEEILNNAINRVDSEALATKLATAMLISGLSGNSVSSIISSSLDALVAELDVSVKRSIEEIKPETGTMTFVVVKVNGEWVISDSRSDYNVIQKIVESPDSTGQTNSQTTTPQTTN